jgi:tRNA dimethylallyltransferase
VALVGPTGSGKSAVAMEAARATGATIVAVDAFTVYRGMDIGTAKPSPTDRAAVPHRMVDVQDVEQECTVRWFQAQARAAVDRLHAANTPVLLVGGSGLYFRAVVDPLVFPPTDAQVRARIAAQVQADPHAAHARLAAVDPEAAAKIEPGNARRTTRALEVLELTGRPFSAFAHAWDRFDQPVWPGLQVIGLAPDPDDLADRIAWRTERMLAAGWIEECHRLRTRHRSRTAAQAIGYAEIDAWLEAGGDLDALPAVAEAISTRTRRFAARQRRWFAGDPRVQWTATRDAPARLTAALGGVGPPGHTITTEDDEA